MSAWASFTKGKWQKKIDVRDFILKNYTPYDGGSSFLQPPTKRTLSVLQKTEELLKKEAAKGGVLDIDVEKVSSLLSWNAGYVDKENELVVGLQTDEPLKRAVSPFGGIRMCEAACEDYGYKLCESVTKAFKFRTTHNDGVFRVYSDEMLKARKSGVITGLPDAYGRGRIIGDYRRVALYGMDFLISEKLKDKTNLSKKTMTGETINLLEDLFKQIEFMKLLKNMASLYGHDISRPANNAKEAVQWLYYGYLGALKEQTAQRTPWAEFQAF